jgi:hypothetical protein
MVYNDNLLEGSILEHPFYFHFVYPFPDLSGIIILKYLVSQSFVSINAFLTLYTLVSLPTCYSLLLSMNVSDAKIPQKNNSILGRSVDFQTTLVTTFLRRELRVQCTASSSWTGFGIYEFT